MLVLLLALAACTPDSETCAADGTTGDIGFHPTLPTEAITSTPYLYVYATDGTPVGVLADGDVMPLPTGPYYVAYGNVRGEDDGTGFAPTYGLLSGTVEAVCVPEQTGTGETEPSLSLSPTYAEQPGSRMLWLSAGESLAAYSPETLAAGGTAPPDLRMDVPLINDFRGFAFDPLGNLWAAASPTYGARLLVFEPGDVTANGPAEAAVIVTNTLFDDYASIREIAFSPDGTLTGIESNSGSAWVGLFGFSPAAQVLALAGDATTTDSAGEASVPADPTWTSDVTGLVTPADLAFTPGGDVWITDQDSANLVRLDAASLGTATITPAATLTVTDGDVALRGPTDLAFLPDGDLLVDFWTDGKLVQLAAASIAGTGPITTSPADGSTFDVLSLPSGLAVTGTGVLWYGDETEITGPEGTVTLDGLAAPADLVVNTPGF